MHIIYMLSQKPLDNLLSEFSHSEKLGSLFIIAENFLKYLFFKCERIEFDVIS